MSRDFFPLLTSRNLVLAYDAQNMIKQQSNERCLNFAAPPDLWYELMTTKKPTLLLCFDSVDVNMNIFENVQ